MTAGSLVSLSQLFCFSVGGLRETSLADFDAGCLKYLANIVFKLVSVELCWEANKLHTFSSCVLLLSRESFFYLHYLLSVMKLGSSMTYVSRHRDIDDIRFQFFMKIYSNFTERIEAYDGHYVHFVDRTHSLVKSAIKNAP